MCSHYPCSQLWEVRLQYLVQELTELNSTGEVFVIQQKLQLSDSSSTCLEPELLYRFHRAEPLYELRFPATTENRLWITTPMSWLIINLCSELLFWPCQQYREKDDQRKGNETRHSFEVYFFPTKNAHHFQALVEILHLNTAEDSSWQRQQHRKLLARFI